MPLLLAIPLVVGLVGGTVFFTADKVKELAVVVGVGAVVFIAIKKLA